MSETLTIKEATYATTASIEAELQAIQAESIGWVPLGGAYLHAGDPEEQVIEVVGLALASMAGASVLWLV
jgi:hypothetical protein